MSKKKKDFEIRYKAAESLINSTQRYIAHIREVQNPWLQYIPFRQIKRRWILGMWNNQHGNMVLAITIILYEERLITQKQMKQLIKIYKSIMGR